MNCPECGATNRETSKFCTKCGTALWPKSGDRSTDLGPYRSVYQEFHDLRPKESSRVPPPSLEAAIPPLAVYHPQTGIQVGDERSIAWSLILSLLTCGIYGFVWFYMIGKDLRKLTPGDDPRPGWDIFLTIVTCSIWGIYIAYKYPKLIDDAQRKVGLRESHLSVVCVLLAIFSVWKVYGFGLIGLALMQSEINSIWRKLRTGE